MKKALLPNRCSTASLEERLALKIYHGGVKELRWRKGAFRVWCVAKKRLKWSKINLNDL
jgi:hypothetical protein